MATAKPSSTLPFAPSSSSTAAADYSNLNVNNNNNNNFNQANYSQNPTSPSNSKSYFPNGGGNLSRTPSTASTSYFTHYPQQAQPQQRTTVSSAPPVDDQTLSNTLANASISAPVSNNNNLQAQPNRQPKFTEEWDASVRGSSIIESPSPHPNQQNNQRDYRFSNSNSNMQRSSSVASHRSEVIPNDGASTHQISLSRGNTLKKKQSLRRSGSLKRSSSRRSMRAGSVRSLALQSSSETDEQHNVFYCPVPTSGNPTDILATRFQG